MTLRCLVRCSTGESRRLRPRQTAKRSVEARRVALWEKKSKSSPVQGWATTPRGYYWGRHLRPSTEGPRSIRIQQQGLLPAQRLKQRRRQAKRSEDQGADSEDEGKRREAKTKAPTAKTKASEERRRPKRRRRRRRQAKRGKDQDADSEDQGKRREAKTKAPTAKT